jgi:hypothetical protein
VDLLEKQDPAPRAGGELAGAVPARVSLDAKATYVQEIDFFLGYATDAFLTRMLAYPFCMTAACQNDVGHRAGVSTWQLLAEL